MGGENSRFADAPVPTRIPVVQQPHPTRNRNSLTALRKGNLQFRHFPIALNL